MCELFFSEVKFTNFAKSSRKKVGVFTTVTKK